MRITIKTIYKSIKKVTPFWITGISLVLALWPLPSEWDYKISINLRVIIATVMICGIIVFSLCDLIISSHRSFQVDEPIRSVKSEEQSDLYTFHIFINYNPLYRSMTMSTIYQIIKHRQGQPVARPLCNGLVLCRGEDEMIEVICQLPRHPSTKCDRIINKLKEYNKKKGVSNVLVVRPFYEEVTL